MHVIIRVTLSSLIVKNLPIVNKLVAVIIRNKLVIRSWDNALAKRQMSFSRTNICFYVCVHISLELGLNNRTYTEADKLKPDINGNRATIFPYSGLIFCLLIEDQEVLGSPGMQVPGYILLSQRR